MNTPFETALQLSKLREVNLKREAGVYGTGYDMDNPAERVRFYIPGSTDANGLTQISALGDLPDAVAGVITLNGGAYIFTHFIDLLGARINCTADTAILGSSSETAGITSTGLTPGSALISSTFSLPIQNLRITVPTGCKAFNIDGTGNPDAALDWQALNVLGGQVGTVKSVSNFVMTNSAFLSGAYGLEFDGTIGTIAFSNSLFSLPAGTMLKILSTAQSTSAVLLLSISSSTGSTDT